MIRGMHSVTLVVLVVNAVCVGFLAWGLAAFQKRMLRRWIPADYQKLRPDGWVLLMGMAAFWMGLLFIVSFVLAKTEVRPVMEGSEKWMPVIGVVFFLFSGKITQAYFRLLGVSPKGLAWWTPKHKKKGATQIAWKEVKSVSASGFSGSFTIRTKGGAIFGNYFYGGQMPALLDAFDQHLPKSAMNEKTRTVFAKLRARIAKYARKG